MIGRADKRKKIAPHVPEYIHSHVHDVRIYLSIDSDGEAGRRLVLAAIQDVPTLNRMSLFLWRDYAFGTHFFPGHRDHEDVTPLIEPRGEVLDRLSMRFSQDEWAQVDALGFAMGKATAHAAAALLYFAYHTERVTEIAAPGFVERSPYSLKRGSVQWDSSIRSSRFRA